MEVSAVVGHLLLVPTCADAEQEAAVGKMVEAGDLFGGLDRVALNYEANAGGNLEVLRREGRGCQRDEGVERMPVVLGQLAAAGPRTLTADRDVGMLGDPQRLESGTLDQGRELGHGDAVIGRKNRDGELHMTIVTTIASRRLRVRPAPAACWSRRYRRPESPDSSSGRRPRN